VMRNALVLGGTGLLGSAVARRLVAAGDEVTVTGRDPAHLPADLLASGVRFVAVDRSDVAGIDALVGDGVDVLVDGCCFTAADARGLLGAARRAACIVMLSSKAVYVDAEGRHLNSLEPPVFDGPVPESQPTVGPSDADYQSREGYAQNKVAAERILLDSGLPVSVLRVSKAHGRGAPRPREWAFVRRALDGRRDLPLAHRGEGRDHPSAAVNVAALVETVSRAPGARVLNAADPDAPTGLEIARTIAAHLGVTFDERLLDGDPAPPVGAHPWDVPAGFVLDLTAASALGYRAVGTYAETVAEELDWLVELAGERGVDGVVTGENLDYFAPFLDYATEDAYLAGAAR
jgi:nucleoside-diphosphate-sugar epimerase